MPPMRGSVELDAARCKACGLCAHFCPKGCFAPSGELNSLGYRPFRFKDGADCTACGVCGWVCPDLAIHIFTERPASAPAPTAANRKVRS